MLKIVVGLLLLIPQIALAAPDLVYVLAGQSNMNGKADSVELSPEEAAIPANVEYWNKDVLRSSFNETSTFGPEVTFAHGLSAAFPHRHIVIIKYAVGGTSMYCWVPDWTREKAAITDNEAVGPLYRKMIRTVRTITEGRQVEFGGFLWAQGEKEAMHLFVGRDYYANVRSMFTALRTDLSANICIHELAIDAPPTGSTFFLDVAQA